MRVTLVAQTEDRRLPVAGMAEYLRHLSQDAGISVAGLWGVQEAPPTELARILFDRGILLRRALHEGWVNRLDNPPEEMWELGVWGDEGPAWELLAEVASFLPPRTNRLAVHLGLLSPIELVSLTGDLGMEDTGSRHETLQTILTELLRPERVEEAVMALPRELMLRFARRLDSDDIAKLRICHMTIDSQHPAVELTAAFFTAARKLESMRQRDIIEKLKVQMAVLPVQQPVLVSVATQLRAGALAACSCHYDLNEAAKKFGLPIHLVALGFALDNDEVDGNALDGGDDKAIDQGLRYLLSPASPTRAAGEALLCSETASGGHEVGLLAWVVLVQIAALPPNRAVPLEDLMTIIASDAEALGLEHAKLVPTNLGEVAHRYLGSLLVTLQTMGLAWPAIGQGIAFDSTRLQQALQIIADDKEVSDQGAAAKAGLHREGSDIVVSATDKVPLDRLRSLSLFVSPVVRNSQLVFRLTPAHLSTPERKNLLLAAVNMALG